jgi:hypothetical protein
MWYISTIEFDSAMKKNEIMLFADKWIELKNFMLRDVSQTCNIYDHIVREDKIVLVILSERVMGGGKGKENVRE